MVEKYHFKKVWWPARPPLPKWQMSQKSFLFNPLLTIQQAHRNFFWKGAARWQNSVKQNLLTMLLILRMVLRKALAIALSFVSVDSLAKAWQQHFHSLGRDYLVIALDTTAVSIFEVILVELTNTVFVKSNNITANVETAMLSIIAWYWLVEVK